MLRYFSEMAGINPPLRASVAEITLSIPPMFMAENNLCSTLTETENIIFPIFVALNFVPAFPCHGRSKLDPISVPINRAETLGHLAFILGMLAGASTPPELAVTHSLPPEPPASRWLFGILFLGGRRATCHIRPVSRNSLNFSTYASAAA